MTEVQFSLQELTDRYFPIYFYRRHLDLAAKDLLGLTLSPHHRLILRDWSLNKPINMVFASRGIGKSVIVAIFYVLMCMLYPYLKLVVVAGTGFRGSKMLLIECERIIKGFLSGQEDVQFALASVEDPRKILRKDPAYWSITFANGSEIRAVPLGLTSDGSGIRGLRAHLLGEDESFLIPTKLYQASLEPMQNVLYQPNKPAEEQLVKNMLISVSTCDFTFRDFYQQYEYYKSVLETGKTSDNEEEITKDDISLFNFDIDDSYYYDMYGKKVATWGIDYNRIMKKKNLPTTDINLWMAENKNVPLNITGGYFSFADIERGMNIILDNDEDLYPSVLDSCSAQCILGVDTAPSNDNTAFVIIKAGLYNNKNRNIEKCLTANLGQPCPFLGKNNSCQLGKHTAVIYSYQENTMSQQDRVKKIYELLDRYNIIAIGMDKRGGGLELSDLLKDKMYISNLIGYDAKPITDPKESPRLEGLPILTMYSTTQEMNLAFNGYLKGLISNTRLLFPRPLRERPDNPRILEAAGHCETLVSQIARIKATPRGKSVSFEIEAIDPESGRTIAGRKDLYSALLYSVAKMKELIDEKMAFNENAEIPIARPLLFKL